LLAFTPGRPRQQQQQQQDDDSSDDGDVADDELPCRKIMQHFTALALTTFLTVLDSPTAPPPFPDLHERKIIESRKDKNAKK
jgi:hypothetical protein